MNGKGEPREPLEFQTCGKIESVTLDTFANVKVVNPARVEIEMTLTQLGRVSNDRADPECAPDKAVERIACWASIVRDLLDPAFNKADAKPVFESFDRQHFQVGQDAVLKMCVWILRVELHVPDAAQFNIRLRKNLCVGHAWNERPVVQAQIDQSAGLERSGRRPKT